MKKFAKILGWAIVAILVISVGGPLIAIAIIDPEYVKAEIETRALAKTGRTLRIGGDVELSAYPWLGAKVNDVTIGNAPGFGETPFARIAKANVQVKLLPLLDKRVEMDTVVVDGFELNIQRKADGSTNFDDLTALATNADAGSGGDAAAGALALGGLELQGGTITWRDALASQDVAISALALRTGALDLENPVIPVAASFLVDSQRPGIKGAVALSATFSQTDAKTTWLAQGAKLDLDASGAALQGGTVKGTLSANISYDQAKGDVILGQLKLVAPELAHGKNAGGIDANIGELAYRGANQSVEFSQLDISATNVKTPSATGSFKVTASSARYLLDGSDLSAATVYIDSPDLKAQGFAGALKATIGALTMTPSTGQVRSKGLDLNVANFSLNGMTGTLAAKGDAQFDPSTRKLQVDNLNATANLKGGALGKGKLPVKLSGTALFDLTKGVGAIPGLAFEATNFDVDDTRGSLKAAGDLAIQLAGPRLKFKKLTLSANLAGRAVRGGKARLTLTSAVDANLGSKVFSLTGMEANVSELSMLGVRGSLRLSGNATGNSARNVWTAKGLRVTADLVGKDLPGGKLKGVLTATAVLDSGKQKLTVSKFGAKTLGISAKGNVAVTGLGSSPVFRGDVSVGRFSPRKLMARLNITAPKLKDRNTLSNASFGATFSGTTKRIRLKPLLLKLDDTTLRGEFSADGFPRPRYRFNLAANGIDADRYMAAKARKGKSTRGSSAATPGAAAAAATTLPPATLRSLNLNGRLSVGRLKIANLRLAKVSLTAKGKDGLIRLSPVSARLYRGTYAGNITLDARGKVPALRVDEKLNNIDIDRFLTDLNGEAPLGGRVTLAAKLTTTGDNGRALVRGLNGNIDFNVQNGIAQGPTWNKYRNKIRNGLGQLALGGVQCNLSGVLASPTTRFNQLIGTATVKNGVVQIPQRQMIKIRAQAQKLDIDAFGSIDLPKERVDLRTQLKVYEKCQVLGQKIRFDLSKIKIPVRIVGPLSKPETQVDQSVVSRAIEKVVAGFAGKLIQREAEKFIGGNAGKLLKGLLGN
ncbi:MAG: AsmA family protein [Chromatiales bacterium]|jgi:uncharacterized protein involved in outer membrane biogenesis|nr:AsmA family protein [Chromatiales bacterium]